MITGILAILLGAGGVLVGRLAWRDPRKYWTPLTAFWGGPTPLTVVGLGVGFVVAGIGAIGMSAGATATFHAVLLAGMVPMAIGVVLSVWHPRWAMPPAMRDRGDPEP